VPLRIRSVALPGVVHATLITGIVAVLRGALRNLTRLEIAPLVAVVLRVASRIGPPGARVVRIVLVVTIVVDPDVRAVARAPVIPIRIPLDEELPEEDAVVVLAVPPSIVPAVVRVSIPAVFPVVELRAAAPVALARFVTLLVPAEAGLTSQVDTAVVPVDDHVVVTVVVTLLLGCHWIVGSLLLLALLGRGAAGPRTGDHRNRQGRRAAPTH
jgi:hypothetical protein